MQVEDPAKSAEAKHKEEEEEQIHPRGVHHELGHKKDQHEHGEAPFTTPVAAFCGIARPEQFFQGLKNLKLQLVGEYSYGDHYTYPDEILKEMVHVAVEAGATAMITTAKDYARLGKQVNFFPKTLPLVVAQLKVEIDDIETHELEVMEKSDQLQPSVKTEPRL